MAMIIRMNELQHGAIRPPAPIRIDLSTGSMGEDARIERASKSLGDLRGVFVDESARSALESTRLVYAVEYWKPAQEGTEGGLYWGNSTIFPGVVGAEYFMTRGHFHALRNRAEYYATVAGTGMLVLMDEERRATVQEMSSGSTHYIPGHMAHRVVNTGDVALTFLACWPSDAGYDYETINRQGFSVRILRSSHGQAEVVAQP